MTVEGFEAPKVPTISGNFPVTVGGYGPAGLIIHIGLTLVTVGVWLPVLVTYLVGWRKRIIIVNISDGIVVGSK